MTSRQPQEPRATQASHRPTQRDTVAAPGSRTGEPGLEQATRRADGGRDLPGAGGVGPGESSLASAETTYWRNHYQAEPYFQRGMSFADYEPAYRTGIEARGRYAGQRFDEIQDALRSDWESRKGNSPLGWEQARNACRAGWEHAGIALESDRDAQVPRR